MRRSTTQRRKEHGEVIPPLSVSDRIDSLLKEHLAIFTTKTELTEAEIEHWQRDLGRYSLAAIEYAFDCWRRGGRFFPVYADIIELCDAWLPSETTYKHGCSAECKAQHGTGYGESDVMALAKIFAERYPEGLKRRLSREEREALIDELDRRRKAA